MLTRGTSRNIPPLGEERKAHPLARLWRYAAAHRRRVLLASACSVTNRLLDIAPPALIGLAIDVVIKRQDSFLARFGVADARDQLLLLALLTLLIWLGESVFEYAFKVLWRNLAQRVEHQLRVEAFAQLQRQEMRFFEQHSSGGLMAILNDDVNQLERFLDSGASSLIQVGTSVVVIGGTFIALAPSVGLLALLPMPLVLWGSFRFQARVQGRYTAVREEVAALNRQLSASLGGIATVKSFAAEEREVASLRRQSLSYLEANRAAIALSSAFSPLIRMVIVVGFIGTMLLGGWLALDGHIEVGLYGMMVFLTQRLLWPLTRLGETVDQYHRAMASTTRVLDLLDRTPAIQTGGRSLELASGELRFEQVRFGYPSSALEQPAAARLFDGLDLTLPGGRMSAIVGATGAGKSTLIKLLLRFYDVDGGSLRLDGQDVRELRLSELRQAIGLVSQEVFLFDGSVRDNICYGRQEVSDEALRRAAEAAEAHAFIQALPQGYDTMVGERGVRLSGGQRQRISLARALLLDPPILVLDEATSAVDNDTEAAIQRSLAKLAAPRSGAGGRTTVVIAHRLSTVRNADQIVVLDKGRVAERGRHQELLDKDGLYASLWRVQTGELVTSAAAS